LRFFTVESASRLIPVLAPVIELLREQKRLLEHNKAELDSMLTSAPGNGGHQRAYQAERIAFGVLDRMDRELMRLGRLGCEVRDIELGIVDFPSLYLDAEVYLCWQLGESRIAFWHEADAGFAGRQPIKTEADFKGGYRPGIP
jgi:hypothetical protein